MLRKYCNMIIFTANVFDIVGYVQMAGMLHRLGNPDNSRQIKTLCIMFYLTLSVEYT